MNETFTGSESNETASSTAQADGEKHSSTSPELAMQAVQAVKEAEAADRATNGEPSDNRLMIELEEVDPPTTPEERFASLLLRAGYSQCPEHDEVTCLSDPMVKNMLTRTPSWPLPDQASAALMARVGQLITLPSPTQVENERVEPETPAERLGALMEDAQLRPASEEERASLLANPMLVNMLKIWPLPAPAQERCLHCIQEVMGETPPIAETVTPIADERAAMLNQLQRQEEIVETREAEIDAANVEKDETIAAQAAAVEDILKSQVSAGTLAHYRTEAAQIIEAEYEGEAQTNALAALESFLADHEVNLKQIETLLTTEERDLIFGGALADKVILNLDASSNAGRYASVFAAIEAGPISDTRKQELLRQVEQQLGRPNNARQLKDVLQKGRGTKLVPSGKMIRDENGDLVPEMVSQTLEFNKQDRLRLSDDPLVEAFPVKPGSQTYEVEAQVPNGQPVSLVFDIPENGPFPAAAITDQINSLMAMAQWRSCGLSGALESLVGQGHANLGVNSTINLNAQSSSGVQKALERMCLGENTVSGNRFYTGAELDHMGQGLRWLTINGNFGPTNQVDAARAAKLMKALFGDSPADIIASSERAMAHVNSGGIENPSFQRLYAKLHPEDAAAGYPKLQKVVGESLYAQMQDDLPKIT